MTTEPAEEKLRTAIAGAIPCAFTVDRDGWEKGPHGGKQLVFYVALDLPVVAEPTETAPGRRATVDFLPVQENLSDLDADVVGVSQQEHHGSMLMPLLKVAVPKRTVDQF